ncbi:hypothetical protein [Curtobacterium sp. VKM Ac-1393]|uniref:hypothetical protein n=1 Tax=Curtobacterium sp. VKM Ac-1393 TaxID=2783814 RepID=UPI00188BE87B|nr:hypothetical protein [Curtobacterium sp. VKM Ac-1393]MBF4606539.1 hypothetical protein [Curtobacterium sp. VKM Ac-1393]
MDDVLHYFAGRDGHEEPAKVSIYDVWVHAQRVRLEVTDRGEAAGITRFSVVAFAVDVPEADRENNRYGVSVGNPDATVDGALSMVHWNIFEQER